MNRTCIVAIVLAFCLGSEPAPAFPPPPGKAWYSGIKSDGYLLTTLGVDAPRLTSIFNSPDTQSGNRFSTRRFNAVLRVRKPGTFLMLFDGMLENDSVTNEDLNQGDVNQLFLAYDVTDVLRVRVGKQRMLWGHGFAYIPTDFINPPLDPTALNLIRPGINAISADYSSEKFAITGILSKGDGDVVLGGEGFKLTSSAFTGVDMYLIYYRSDLVGNAGGVSIGVDPSLAWFPKWPSFLIYGSIGINQKSRYPSVIDAEISAGGETIAYPAVGPKGSTGPFVSCLAAASYEFTSVRLGVSAEYYRIGDAYSPGNRTKIMNALQDPQSLEGQFASPWLNQLTAFGRTQQQYLSLAVNHRSITEGVNRFTDSFGYQIGYLVGLDDGSTFLTAAIQSNYFSHAEFIIRSFQPFGPRNTEFGSMPFDWNVQFLAKFSY